MKTKCLHLCLSINITMLYLDLSEKFPIRIFFFTECQDYGKMVCKSVGAVHTIINGQMVNSTEEFPHMVRILFYSITIYRAARKI